MIELPGIGAMVLDAMTQGRWRVASEIAREPGSRVYLEPAAVRTFALLIVCWDTYEPDRLRPSRARCAVCDNVVETRWDSWEEIWLLADHSGREETCPGSSQDDSACEHIPPDPIIPIAHGYAPVNWPHNATGYGLEDMRRVRVGGQVRTIDSLSTLERRRAQRITVDRRGVVRWYRAHDASGKTLFEGIVGNQREILPGADEHLLISAAERTPT